jgi:hypothetical protein
MSPRWMAYALHRINDQTGPHMKILSTPVTREVRHVQDEVTALLSFSSAVDCYHSGCFRQPTMISA